MGTMIDQYNGTKREHAECVQWASMIGKHYRGGGGGYGEVRSVTVDAEIYYQESDGSNNYHEMPKALAPYMQKAIKEKFGVLLNDALAMREADLKAIAQEAVAEHGRLLQAAGIVTV